MKGSTVPHNFADNRPAPATWAIITPSYAPDLERCKILCRSIDLCIKDDFEHILIVDRRDFQAFSPLISKRRRILIVEDLLPWWIRSVPITRRCWLNLRGKPIRNWVLQQILKIHAAATTNKDAILFLDSDVTFVRPFSLHHLEQNGKIALARVPFTDQQHSRWLENAGKMLGTSKVSDDVNYIGNFVSWRSDVARQLVDHLGQVRNRHWINQFASHWHISEYMVYGTFVEQVLGLEKARHFPTATPLVHLSWGHSLTTPQGIDAFFGAIAQENVAIMIHSKDNISPGLYLHHLQALWDQVSAPTARPTTAADMPPISPPQGTD